MKTKVKVEKWISDPRIFFSLRDKVFSNLIPDRLEFLFNCGWIKRLSNILIDLKLKVPPRHSERSSPLSNLRTALDS